MHNILWQWLFNFCNHFEMVVINKQCNIQLTDLEKKTFKIC